MSSRHDGRRRERSWERDDRDRERGKDRHPRGNRAGGQRDGGRKRGSRSRSPRRDRRDHDRDYRDRDYKSSRREDHDRDSRRDDRRPERRDERREPPTRDKEPRHKDPQNQRDHRQQVGRHDSERVLEKPSQARTPPPVPSADAGPSSSQKRPNLDPDALSEEEGEAMDAANADEEAMMAAMGLQGFGTTKGKHVEGNQEGFVDIKKTRTWRQYMNRRGGFNRPLDKVK
ncbi:uncharacterized protein F5891DRAFT_1138833 [Suillus fuscotomentosus]|uniref:U4/U6.U5 small nuclear ribonucleoprotein 27kDa protein domain-containing protein n=1 Tax=Suillus fuscotomentosus TaxID=1912939 RepID=A0AAD4EGR8_9AGAM|nr:uncharacterized protein F5891DRAFT_1138833 [Suillus fuscotomentosus]KAG1905933.1 hypothetical protein F5891DRAFT_1138833 [Suillus fuscotomentosus]